MTGHPEPELAVVNCAQLVTLAGPRRPRIGAELRELAIIPDGAMLIRDGLIQAIGKKGQVEPLLSSKTVIVDAPGKIVLPGFVDAHTHPVFAGNRVEEFEQRAEGMTYEAIAARGGGIRSTVRRTREASAAVLYAAAQRYQAWFLRGGTTTIEAKSGYGLTLQDELKLLTVIRRLSQAGPVRYVPTFLGAHEIPDEYRGRVQAYVELIIHEMIPEVAKQQLAEYCDVFCEPGIFDVPASAKILGAARDWGLGIRVHADQLTRSGGAEMAAELGAATADHLEQIDSVGIKALAQAQVQPVLLPASAYVLGKRFAPAREMIEAGLAVVLATDFNPGSSPTTSMGLVLSLASTQMRMTPAEAILATTVNAAYSLGRGNQLGTLEAGKQADFVIHDCQDYREIAYFAGIESAAAVYIAGELVFERGHSQLPTAETEPVLDQE
jgi:imidazolonepropionase